MNILNISRELTSAEKKLVRAVKDGVPADLRTPSDDQRSVIRAEVLRKQCIDQQGHQEGGNGVHLIGARIVGRLDLARAHLPHSLRFENCDFEDRIDLSDARAEEAVEWIGGLTSTIVADRFESRADVTISDVTVRGTISLHWANIQGDLRCTDSKLHPPQGPALNGTDLRVGGSLFLDGSKFHAAGEVSLWSAHIRGSLDCRRARFDNPSGYSINAARLSLRGEMLCEKDFTARGEVCLEHAKIGRLQATGGRFSNSGGCALRGDALRARSGVYLDSGFYADGSVRLVGAVIAGELICTNGRFHNPGEKEVALNAKRLRAQDVYLDNGFQAHGAVRLDGAQLTRQLNCTNGKFDNDQGYALDCDGIRCDGEVFLNKGFTATGEVRLVGAKIAYELNCTGGHFNNQAGKALNAEGLTTGNIFLNSEQDHQFHALGQVFFPRATIGQQLMLSGAVLQNADSLTLDLTGLVCHGNVLLNGGFRSSGKIEMPGARIARDLDFTESELYGDQLALDARGVQVDGCLKWKLAQQPRGEVDLSSAKVTRLNDDLTRWPKAGKLTLTGFDYQTLDESSTAEDRIGWLSKAKYSPDAYQKLANVYRMSGREDDAATVAIACQKRLRKDGGPSKRSKLWNLFLEVTTGYGYKLHRPLVLLAVFAVIGTVIFSWAQSVGLMYATNPATNPPSLKATSCISGYLCFQPIIYSLQLLVPVVDLQETSRWLPDTSTTLGRLVMLYTWIAIVIGWAASMTLAAGFGRLLRQR